MSAEKVITALLLASADVVALVADRIGYGPLEQNTGLPALATNLISEQRRNTSSTAESSQLMMARMQVTVLARSYDEQKELINLVDAACRYKRGTFAGVPGVSTLPELRGPDMRDDDARVFMQTIDFMVAYLDQAT